MRPTIKMLSCLFPLLTVQAGCGGDSPAAPPAPSITGTWAASGTTASITMTLRDIGGAVLGTGQWTQPNLPTLTLGVTGTETAPDVTLTITPTGYQSMTFAGTFAGNTMTGTLTGSGFTGQSITLTKQATP